MDAIDHEILRLLREDGRLSWRDLGEPERKRVCEAAVSGEYGRREVTIRINGMDTPWHADDLRAVAEAGPAAVVVPKVNSAAGRSSHRVSRVTLGKDVRPPRRRP